jgi:acyl-homoserine-lactone acylase
LRKWDYRWSAGSIPTSVAVYWGEHLTALVQDRAERAGVPPFEYMVTLVSASERLSALSAACDRLTRDFGTWRTQWGEINRFQRLTGDIVQQFNDNKPSIPVPFTSARWGSLASFGARTYPGTKRMYGTGGNSFVAVVEFGQDSVRARAVTAGGESGNPRSRHFNDQAERYASGRLRQVYFYPGQLQGHTERKYHPGE